MLIDYTTEIEKCKPVLNRYVLGHGEKEQLRADLNTCDANTIFTCQLVMFIGRDLVYRRRENTRPYKHPEKVLASWAQGIPKVPDTNKDGEISYLLEKIELRRFLKCGMQVLGMLQESDYPVSFYDWAIQRWRKKDGYFKDNRFGDLAADMQCDCNFPQTCSDISVLRSYFECVCRCQGSWNTAKEALRKYQVSRNSKPTVEKS